MDAQTLDGGIEGNMRGRGGIVDLEAHAAGHRPGRREASAGSGRGLQDTDGEVLKRGAPCRVGLTEHVVEEGVEIGRLERFFWLPGDDEVVAVVGDVDALGAREAAAARSSRT